VKDGFIPFKEKQGIKWATKVLDSRKLMNMASGKTKNMLAAKFATKSWGSKRKFPKIADKSFNELWKEKNDT